ncbi:GNAT family N-acetyltransferase [Paenibacillus melissococcoides]|uniref:GNAT family N-acetyltransferase n=1 Tax=Paenibacillus melissococcoides TaxID=2912268 RepID=A0ABM9G5F7_9BACL|nr:MULTISPECIES: GNAT family protein [Paenibacillus]MEB9895954.1 GNAT family protein [Bacillus cereus]CAH8246599.1 GNAT family N-acetyltransferase [Paenibacillus melissococcoides]CAH8715220.1 GNAT family N-acetyltransferase [Paenibacillus melissococcoides]CAH8716151.1 GNAT family N-acetyltransferase [Paenibacillus melissococcoides]GIO80067.1 putative N-acetyltransferase YoaA [Paenibacillus dendritiformis]
MSGAFTFQAFPCLQTECFLLRAMEERDCRDIFDLYSLEDVVRYTPLEPFQSIQDVIREWNWHQQIFAEQSGLRWVIEEKSSAKVIGTCGFLQYEKTHRRIELGYDLAPPYWGRGVMTEAAQRILSFGFRDIGVNRIEAKIDPENIASERLLLRLGFQKEGVMRQQEFEKERYVDIAVFSILKREFDAQRQALTSDV